MDRMAEGESLEGTKGVLEMFLFVIDEKCGFQGI